MQKEKGIEEEAEEIIKEGEAIEKAIQQERQNQASEDDEIEESSLEPTSESESQE